MSAKERTVRDLRKLAELIERVDTPLKILHAQVSAEPETTKPNKRA